MTLTIIFTLVAAALLLGGYMICVEPKRFRVRRMRVPVHHAAGVGIRRHDFPPLRILHVTDTHFCGRDRAKLEFLLRVSREHYDLVFFTGDLIDTPAGLESCVGAAHLFCSAAGLRSCGETNHRAGPARPAEERPLAAFAVLGGHDYYWASLAGRYAGLLTRRCKPGPGLRRNPGDELAARLAQAGVTVLCDENRIVHTPRGDVAVVGLQDTFCFDVDYDGAWDGLSADLPVIVLAHSPDVLAEIVRRGADLALFGHTHGGQIRLPLIGALVTRCDLSPRRASGVFMEGKTVFTLNNGLGAGVGINYRLFCPPEVSDLTIMRSGESAAAKAEDE